MYISSLTNKNQTFSQDPSDTLFFLKKKDVEEEEKKRRREEKGEDLICQQPPDSEPCDEGLVKHLVLDISCNLFLFIFLNVFNFLIY